MLFILLTKDNGIFVGIGLLLFLDLAIAIGAPGGPHGDGLVNVLRPDSGDDLPPAPAAPKFSPPSSIAQPSSRVTFISMNSDVTK